MKLTLHKTYRRYLTGAAILCLVFVNQGCQKNLGDIIHSLENKNPQTLKDFSQVNLVANNDQYHAVHVDPHLLNAWGLTFSSNGIAWISSQAGHVSSVYDSAGNMLAARPEVAIPSPGGATGGNPTGTVVNSDPTATDFKLSNGSAGRFFFVGLDGIISGWNPAAGNNALVIANNAGSAYTGLTMAKNSSGEYHLYAANFSMARIDVWNKDWAMVSLPFKDPDIPSGYSPYNIQSIGDLLYVMYAKVAANGHAEPGSGLGFVDIYNVDGNLEKRFVSRGQLNAPWGVAWAPASFFDGDDNPQAAILVGNFGDGHINAYTTQGAFLGKLRMHGQPIVIDGLWALMFAPSTAPINPNKLYFTAGPDNEMDGLFGYISK
jgi:uncharacterized protein (TIGR03118 family)